MSAGLDRHNQGDESKGTSPVASPIGPEAPERGSLFDRVRVNAYIDGFNLYFVCLENTPYRWLNVARLCEHLLDPLFPRYELNHIRYFTAPIQARGDNWARTSASRSIYAL